MPSTALRPETRDRILAGAARAVARHGLAKLGMHDVSASAAVSRGTLYRYFPNRDELLRTLAHHEGERLQAELRAAVARAEGAERLRVALEFATRRVQDHPVLQRLLETDPARVLRSLRRDFPAIRAGIQALLAPLLAETAPVRRGVARVEQLADWLTRLMVTAYLLPDPDPAQMTDALTAVYRVLTTEPDAPRPARRRRRAPRRS